MSLPESANGTFYLSERFGSFTKMYSNTSIFPSLKIIDNGSRSQCWAAKMNESTLILEVFRFNCNQNDGVVCRKFLLDNNICGQSSTVTKSTQKIDSLEMLLNPGHKLQFKKSVAQKKKDLVEMFARMDMKTSFNSLFNTLWYSNLPCYDVTEVTSEFNGDKAMLKYCNWKGRTIPCSAIFTKFPTDKGLCCSFNMKAAEEIFSGDMYPQMLKNMQNKVSISSTFFARFFHTNVVLAAFFLCMYVRVYVKKLPK